jgi:hypothetical protein
MSNFLRAITLLASIAVSLPLSAASYLRNQEFKEATPEELALKSIPNAPGAHAAILLWTDFQDDVASAHSEYFRIKIFDEEGKKNADIEIPYIRNYSGVRDIKARTIRPDGTIVPFEGKVFDKLIVKSKSVRVMAKTFTLPDVQPGSIIEYRYVTTWPATSLFSTRWVLQRDLPIVKANLTLKPYSDGGFAMYFLHVGVEKLPQWMRDHYELEVNNVPPFEKEEFALPEAELKPRVEFFYHVGTLGTEEEFWKREGKSAAENVESFIGNRSGIKKAVATIVDAGDDSLTKVKKIYARVQQLENLSYAKESTEQEEKRQKHHDNRHVEDVLVNGYGYHGELNRLFVALARAAGLEASSVLIATRDDIFFSKQLLDLQQLNSEIAVVTINGQPWYVDAGVPNAPFGLLPWSSSGVAGLKLAKKEESSWIKTPDEKKENALTSRDAKLTLEDGILKGTVHVEFVGQEALLHRLDWLHDDETARRKSVEDEVKEWLPEGAKVTLTKLEGSSASDAPIAADLSVELPGLESNAGSRTLLRLSVFEARAKNPFASQTRRSALYFEYNHVVNDRVELTLPAGYKVENVPADTKIDLKAFLFNNVWKNEGSLVRLQRQYETNTLIVGRENYATLRDFFSRMQTADEATLVLRKL